MTHRETTRKRIYYLGNKENWDIADRQQRLTIICIYAYERLSLDPVLI
jgi:hypothetical protein